MGKNFYEDDYSIITDSQAETIADGLSEFTDVYLRFLIPNIEDTKLKKYLKKLKKMIKKIKDKKKRNEVFNLKMIRLITDECDDENRGLYD